MISRTRAGLAYLALSAALLLAGGLAVWLFGSDSAIGVSAAIPLGLGLYLLAPATRLLWRRKGERSTGGERPKAGGFR